MYLHLSLSYFLKELVSPSLFFFSSSGLCGNPNVYFSSTCQCIKPDICQQGSQSVLWQATYPGKSSSREVENHCPKIGIWMATWFCWSPSNSSDIESRGSSRGENILGWEPCFRLVKYAGKVSYLLSVFLVDQAFWSLQFLSCSIASNGSAPSSFSGLHCHHCCFSIRKKLATVKFCHGSRIFGAYQLVLSLMP